MATLIVMDHTGDSRGTSMNVHELYGAGPSECWLVLCSRRLSRRRRRDAGTENCAGDRRTWRAGRGEQIFLCQQQADELCLSKATSESTDSLFAHRSRWVDFCPNAPAAVSESPRGIVGPA
jgi:hypothetical protein